MFVGILALSGAYFIGSIPVGFLIARWHGIENIRAHGSGNTGATNVARLLGLRYFFVVFFLDTFKAWALLYVFSYYGLDQKMLMASAVALLIGNARSPFLKFKGGKGVSTSFGILLALHPFLLLCACVVWFFSFILTKTVGIASVCVLLSLPFISLFLLHDQVLMFLLIVFIAAWGLIRHKANICRYIGIG